MDVHVLAEEGAREAIEQYCREQPGFPVRFTFFKAGPAWMCGHSGLRYICWQWTALRVARGLLAAELFDLVHHVTFGSVHVPTQLWRLGIPVVFGPVGGGNTAPACMLSYFGKSRWKERWRTLTVKLLPFSPFHRRSYRRIDALLGTNLETLDLFRAMGRPDAALFADTGLPEEYFAGQSRIFAETGEPLRILWVGRLLPRKALLLTLDVLAKVSAPFTLTVLGDGAEETEMRSLIQERGLEGRVFWKRERVPWTEVRKTYATHDVFLFNSLRDSFGSQLLEAMAMGLPVICLDMSGARDLVPAGAGLKVPVQGKAQVLQDLVATVERFATMPAWERSAMSKTALEAAQAHSWRARAGYAENLYGELLAGVKSEPADISRRSVWTRSRQREQRGSENPKEAATHG